MRLNGYMRSPVGFGVYGEVYTPEIVELSEGDEDLAPLASNNTMSWVTPSQFSGFGGAWGEIKGTVLGVGAGTLTGLATNHLKDELPVESEILKSIAAPIVASAATLIIYWLVSP